MKPLLQHNQKWLLWKWRSSRLRKYLYWPPHLPSMFYHWCMLLHRGSLPPCSALKSCMGPHFLFMSDNGTFHRTVAVIELLEIEDIHRMHWLTKFSNLNPNEHAWDIFRSYLAAHHQPIAMVLELGWAQQWNASRSLNRSLIAWQSPTQPPPVTWTFLSSLQLCCKLSFL